MQTFKIASLGEGNKSAYTTTGARYFIPVRFRTNVKVGDFMLVVTSQPFTERTNPETGAREACAPWTREEITMVGDFTAVTVAKNEDKINAGLESQIVNREIKKLAKEFSLDKELEAASAAI